LIGVIFIHYDYVTGRVPLSASLPGSG